MAQHPRRLSIEEMQGVAADRGGRCLSPVYLGSLAHLEWECPEGHRWRAVPNNIKRGTWCPVCARSRQGGNAHSVTVEGLRDSARSRGGECLSHEYLGMFVKHRWRCSDGHEWEAVPSSIKAGTWCPKCANVEKPSYAIEDMQVFANGMGGQCLSKAYSNNRASLAWQCADGHRWCAPYRNVKRGFWCPECESNRKPQPRPQRAPIPASPRRIACRRSKEQLVADLQRSVEERGGQLLTGEFNSRESVLLLRCSQGHVWQTHADSVLTGHWCHACGRLSMEAAYRKRFGLVTLDDADEVALWADAQGLTLVTAGKLGLGRTDFFRCPERHMWEISRPYSRPGSWCPVCGARGEGMGVGRTVR